MELTQLVRSLAEKLSHLSPEESGPLEGSGAGVEDIQERLSSHLVDQFWSYLLRNSPHCRPPRQCRHKHGRYSASRILEDLELGTRKRATVSSRQRDHSTATAISKVASTKKPYQQNEIFVDIALRLHQQAMRRKGLHLESVSLDLLLQLYNHVSHVPQAEHFNKFVEPHVQRWRPFESRDEVLEFLCHASSEPLPCMASLKLARHGLLRKGIQQIRHIDLKLLLDSFNGSASGLEQQGKRESTRDAGFFHRMDSNPVSEHWTSATFDRILTEETDLSHVNMGTESSALRLESLTISQFALYDRDHASINSAWLSAQHSTEQPLIDKEQNESLYADTENGLKGTDNDRNWTTSSTLPGALIPRGPKTVLPESPKQPSVLPRDQVAPCYSVHTLLAETSDRVMNSATNASTFCHVNLDSLPRTKRYSKWQILLSFDSINLQHKADASPGMPVGVSSIREAMVDSTVECLIRRSPEDRFNIANGELDWFRPITLCLQGIESDLFESRLTCLQRTDPSLIPAELRKSAHFGDNDGQVNLKKLVATIFQDFMTSSLGLEHRSAVVTLTEDRNFVKIDSSVLPIKSSDIEVVVTMYCTEALKGHGDYQSLQLCFQEICQVGRVIRRMKYFIAIIKNLENIEKYRQLIGATVSVYATALETFLYHFERDLSNSYETDCRGAIKETVSVYSLTMKFVKRWIKVTSWLDDVTSAHEYQSDDLGAFLLPQGCFFLEHIMAKYTATFGAFSNEDYFSKQMAYHCLVSTMKPYLEKLSQWVTGLRGQELLHLEFAPDNRFRLLSALRPLEQTIEASRQYSVFLDEHYRAWMDPPGCLYASYLEDGASTLVHHTYEPKDTCYTPVSLTNLMRDIALKLSLNHDRINARMAELLRTQHHIAEVMEDISSFVLLSRQDLMDKVFSQWSAGRGSDSYLELYRHPVLQSAQPQNSATSKRLLIQLAFSTEKFNSYIFTENVVRDYNEVFNQLCKIHFAVLSVLDSSRWLLLNFRGPCMLANEKCQYMASRLQSLTQRLYHFLLTTQWYMRHVVLGPLFERFMACVHTAPGLTVLVEQHCRFVERAARMCFTSEQCGRTKVLLNSICSCGEILGATMRTLGIDVLRSDQQVDELLAVEPAILELDSTASKMIREFSFLIQLTNEPGQSHLGLMLSNTICNNS